MLGEGSSQKSWISDPKVKERGPFFPGGAHLLQGKGEGSVKVTTPGRDSRDR